jgi:MarR family transcriptional regulator, organic hydroperoxide resistance regulator
MESLKKPGPLLFLVSKAHHHLASRVFEQMGLNRGQPPVLFELGFHDGNSQAELADVLEVTPATMTNMLRRMEGSGLIIRLRDASDSRISRVYLTDAGRIALDKATHLADQMDEITFAGLTTAELATLTDLLGRVHTNLTGQSFA